MILLSGCSSSEHGEVISNCKYDGADYRVIRSGLKYGLVDQMDSLVILPTYDALYDCKFSGNVNLGIVAVDSTNNCKALYTADGRLVLPCKYGLIFAPNPEHSVIYAKEKNEINVFQMDGTEKPLMHQFGNSVAEHPWILGSEFPEVDNDLTLIYKKNYRKKIDWLMEFKESDKKWVDVRDGRYDQVVEIVEDFEGSLTGPRVYFGTFASVVTWPKGLDAREGIFLTFLKRNRYKLNQVYKEFVNNNVKYKGQITFSCEINKDGSIDFCRHFDKSRNDAEKKVLDELGEKIISEIQKIRLPVSISKSRVEFPIRFSLKRNESLEYPIY